MHRFPWQVHELILDNSKPGAFGQIEGLSDQFENLEILSIMGCSLTGLKTFPKLPKLRKVFTTHPQHTFPPETSILLTP